jgi:hypothetical protein
MAAADVNIVIASEFVGKKAFKEADTATSRLTKQVNSLAKSYLGLYGIQRLARGAGQAARAFAEDDKAAKVLSQTLNNLGLGFGNNAQIVNGYISSLEKQTGVLDDELRPAMDRLLRATGDITKSQKLLKLALDVSAGTGKTLTQVSQSLQKAYLGQTQALGRLGVGLTKAELTSSSFEEIQTRLAVLFEGQAAMAADTYIGKMNKLTVAINNAKETIGEGIFAGLSATGGGGASGFDSLTKVIDAAAKGVAFLLETMGQTTGAIALFAQGKPGSATDLILGRKPADRSGIIPSIATELKKAAAAKAMAKASAQQTKNTKEQTKAIKEQTALQKAGTLFDLQQTQIIAALKGDISAEERKRLELQLAILTGNTTEASKLAGELAKAQGLTQSLVDYYSGLQQAKNPFSGWITTLLNAQELAKNIAMGNYNQAPMAITSIAGNGGAQYSLPEGSQFTSAAGVEVTVNVNAGTVIAEEGLKDVIRDSLLNDSLQAKFAAIYRQGGSFGA